MSTEECKLERADPLHTHTPPIPHTHTKWLPHTYTLSLLISPAALRQGLPDPVQCVYVCACNIETGTDQQAELRLCDQIWYGRESHSSSCSLALRGSHSDRGQSQGHRHRRRGLKLLPLPFASRTDWYQVTCSQEDNTGLSIVFVYMCSPSCLEQGWGWGSCLCVRTQT